MLDQDWEYWLERLELELVGLRSRTIRMEDALAAFQQNIFSKLEKPMPTETETKFYLSPWPSLCDECGNDIAQFAAGRPDLDCFMTYCEHRFTFALLFVGEVDGNRGVIKWDTQGPINQAGAIAIMERMSGHAARIVNLDDPSLQ